MANEAFRTEIAKKYPSLLGKATRSRLAGIRLFCIECHGGSRTEAKKCALRECFLHPHRGKDWEQNDTLA
jgi:hypothetical protein